MSTEGAAAVTQAQAFTKTPGWLDFCAHPSRPRFKLPDGAVDAHCHVFGPGALFPYAPERKYTPCDASKDKLFALRDYLGFTKNVIVQATCHGTDNRALLDALRSAGDRARGVAIVDDRVTRVQLREMHAAGVRGVRFNFLRRLTNPAPNDAVQRIVERIAPLGWHVVVYFEMRDFGELETLFGRLPVPIVVDHMGRPDVAKGVTSPGFVHFLEFTQSHTNIWVKVSGSERLTMSGPYAVGGENAPYADVQPFARKLVGVLPDRVLWGTDWPHPNLKSHMPDDGILVDMLRLIAPTEHLQRRS